RRWRWPLAAVLAAGLAATQSRGAAVGVGAALVLYALNRRRADSVGVFVVVAGAAAALAVIALFGNELATEQQQHFGALLYREQFAQEALAIWQQQPLLGVGIRFWEGG